MAVAVAVVVSVGTFMVAWLMCKTTEPVRLAASIAVVPKLAAVIRRARGL